MVKHKQPFTFRHGETNICTLLSSLYALKRNANKDLSKLPQDKAAPIVAYCAVGHRGAMAVESLRLWGYTNVRSIGGGFNGWVKANLPTVKCATC